MWTFLANPLQETVRTNVIQHKILNNTYLHRFLCSKVESYHSGYAYGRGGGNRGFKREVVIFSGFTF